MILRQVFRKSIRKPGSFEKAGPSSSRALGRVQVFAAACVFALGLATSTLSADGADAISKLDHLLQAAVHLEKAGRSDLAAEIYTQIAAEAEADRQRLADARLEQIRQLEADVARLRTSPVVGDQISVQLKVIQLSLEKLQASGLGLVSIRNLLDSGSSSAVLDEGGQIGAFMELLRREGLVQFVAEPTLVTVNGRPAMLEVGSQPAGQHETGQPAAKLAGLRFACTPQITDSGKISLDLHVRCQTPAEPAETAARAGVPHAVGSLEVRTQVGLRSGETLVLAGPSQSGGSEGERAVLLLVTATIVGPHSPPSLP